VALPVSPHPYRSSTNRRLEDDFWGPPFVGATADAERMTVEGSPAIMKIPVLPISYSDALPLLRAMTRPLAPQAWQGSCSEGRLVEHHLLLLRPGVVQMVTTQDHDVGHTGGIDIPDGHVVEEV